jgi:hypothetical protein
MSKCEVQLILIAAIFKLRRAVQLRILKLFLEFIEKPDLLDYPYIQTVVGADTILASHQTFRSGHGTKT